MGDPVVEGVDCLDGGDGLGVSAAEKAGGCLDDDWLHVNLLVGLVTAISTSGGVLR